MTERSTASPSTTKAPRGVLIGIAVFVVALAAAMRVGAQLPLDAMVEGLAFAGAGLAAWARRPENRSGKLMIAYGVMVWAIHLQNTRVPLLWTAAGILFPAAVFGVLLYLMLAFPRGHLTSRFDRIIIALAFGNVAVQMSVLLFLDPRALGCTDCPAKLNLLLLKPDLEVLTIIAKVNPWWLSLVMFPMIVVLAARWLRASRPGRRVLGPMLIPAIVFLIANRVYGLSQAISGEPFTEPPAWVATLQGAEQIAVTILPITFLLGLLRGRLLHTRVSRLVVELGDLPPADRLEEALGRALGDPSLQVGVWDPATRRYLRANGDVISAEGDKGSRVATELRRGNDPLALVVHDEALLDEPGLVEATAAAARMAVENERLQTEIRAQLEEVRASRQRIVTAQDEERRRIERDLHDGAQQRLLRLSMAIQVATSSIPETADRALRTSLEVAAEELVAALQELRELARGIHPAVLTQRGLGAAIRSLAETAAIPVIVEEVLEARLPTEVETAGYFVVSEALANVTKHASASVARVRARVVDQALEIVVSDDGRGGASMDRGSGLSGLVDRVQALGGELRIESGAGEGTNLVARIPLSGVPEEFQVGATDVQRQDG